MSRSIFDKKTVLSNISVVLASPQVPENIGLVARSLKNTGISRLCLVTPSVPERSFEVAKRARDVLLRANVCADLGTAVADDAFVFGTTRRIREYKTVYNFRDILPPLTAMARKQRVSIVFGKENFGLSREELDLCDSIFYLPAADEFPSYNLAVSAGIVCHAIFEYCDTLFSASYLDLARKKDIEQLFCCIEAGIAAHTVNPRRASAMTNSLKRLLKRTHLTVKEAEMLKSLFLAVFPKK